MSTLMEPVTTPAPPGVAVRPGRWAIVVVGLAALLTASWLLRSTALHAPFWIDEGLSVGISSHSLTDIPGVLRQDGSPPLYYLLLNMWMDVFGDGQATTHVLSLVVALTMVPVAWWAGRSLAGTRAGWICALLAATNPFLTYYAQETRMYSLVCLLSLLVAATFAHAFIHGRSEYRAPFALSLGALLYTHNWGLFLAAGTVVALVPAWVLSEDRPALRRDVLLSYGAVAVLFAPWLPTLAAQAAHTGAPWSGRPSVKDVFDPISGILGGRSVPFGLLLGAGAGLATLARRGGEARKRATVWALSVLPLSALAFAWTASQISPAFTGRYFSVFVGPILLLAAIGLANAGRMGIVALCIVVVLWLDPQTGKIERKSDARAVAALVSDALVPGDLVVSVQPEQAPLMHYYLPPGLRYATSLGAMADPLVFDWRDAVDRLRASDPATTLGGLVAPMHGGQSLLLVLPIIRTAHWGAPWTKLIRRRSGQWQRAADVHPRLVRIQVAPRFGHARLPRGVRAVRYQVLG